MRRPTVGKLEDIKGRFANTTSMRQVMPFGRRGGKNRKAGRQKEKPPEPEQQPATSTGGGGDAAQPDPLRIRDLLTPERVRTGLSATTKKSVLDQLAAQIHADRTDLDERAIFSTLLRREQLGSTAVGNGVAIPHGRLSELEAPIGAFTRLAEPADFDAMDDQPVALVFALLVPDEENSTHLQILARLARMLDDEAFREQLRQAAPEELYDLLVTQDEKLEAQ